MLAMRYGTLPIVRETGGLADTVENFDDDKGDAGTGFVFQWESSEALSDTIHWAIYTFRNRPKAWRRMQERAMKTDLSWEKSASEYAQLYSKAIEKRTGTKV